MSSSAINPIQIILLIKAIIVTAHKYFGGSLEFKNLKTIKDNNNPIIPTIRVTI